MIARQKQLRSLVHSTKISPPLTPYWCSYHSRVSHSQQLEATSENGMQRTWPHPRHRCSVVGFLLRWLAKLVPHRMQEVEPSPLAFLQSCWYFNIWSLQRRMIVTQIPALYCTLKVPPCSKVLLNSALSSDTDWLDEKAISNHGWCVRCTINSWGNHPIHVSLDIGLILASTASHLGLSSDIAQLPIQ